MTRENWQRFKSVDKEKYELDSEGENTLGVVPVVPFLYEPDKKMPMTGRSVIDDVASLIIRVYNQDSEFDKMLFDAAIPLLVAYGLTPEEGEAVVRATSAMWRFGEPTTKLEYVEPSGSAFEAKRQQIADGIESIREISLRQTRPKGSGVESAESKRLDSVHISSQLADFARSTADSERQCWGLAGKLSGVDESEFDNVEIKYNETFDPETMREKLTSLYRELRRDTDISRETLYEQLGWDEKRIKLELERLAKERSNDPPELSEPFGGWGGA